MRDRRRTVLLTLVVVLPIVVALGIFLPLEDYRMSILSACLVLVLVEAAVLSWEQVSARKRSRGLVDGFARLKGQTGEAMTELSPAGKVKVSGEVWDARVEGSDVVSAGQQVAVVGAERFSLIVTLVQEE
ncbi:MAG: hypothetical protein GY906_25360 [bacterium]|nr:hypothetical protein [bacterium]